MVKFVKNMDYYMSYKKTSIPVYICDIDESNIYLNDLNKKGETYMSADYILERTSKNNIEQRGVKLVKI